MQAIVKRLERISSSIPEFCTSHWLLRITLALLFIQMGLMKLPIDPAEAVSYGLSVLVWPQTQVKYFYSRFDSSTGELLWTLPLETEVPVASGLSLDYTGSAYLAHPSSNELNSNEAPVLEYRPD